MKILSKYEEEMLSDYQKIKYYKELKEYLKHEKYNNFSNLKIKKLELFNRIIKKVLKKSIKYNINVEGYENIKHHPVVYASSHQDFNDITNSIYAYPEHVLTLNACNISDKLKKLLNLNGAIYINRDNKESRTNAKIEMMKALSKNKSINLYPEATWNCTPSKMHLPFYIGMIDIARKMHVPIVPVVQEYNYEYDNNDNSKVVGVNIKLGREVFVDYLDDNIEKLKEFDEVFSTLRWDLIEKKGNFKREDITNHDYTRYIKARMKDWEIPGNDINEERYQVYGANDDFYLFHHVNDVLFDENDNLQPTELSKKLKLY